MTEPSLMIFAAGFGTRMGHLTRNVPKPMLPLGGKPMIDHAIDFGRQIGVSEIVANTHYLSDEIVPHLGQAKVKVTFETPDILDTGGGLKAARPHLTSPTYTLNPDALWIGPNPLDVLRNHQSKISKGACVLLVPLARTHNRSGSGDFDIVDGLVTRGRDFVYTGAQLIHTEVLDLVSTPAFSLNEVWDILINREQLVGVEYPGEWMDIGTPEGLAAANARLER